MNERNRDIRSFILGFVAGLVGPVLGAWLFYWGRFGSSTRFDGFTDYISKAYQVGVISEVLALGGVLNLGIFFLFIQLKWYRAARAVIIATLVHVALVILFPFL